LAVLLGVWGWGGFWEGRSRTGGGTFFFIFFVSRFEKKIPSFFFLKKKGSDLLC